MKLIKITMSERAKKEMQTAADWEEMPVSLWARSVLLKEARAIAHKKLCMTKKEEEYMWCGRPCTKEEYEKFSRESMATNPR